MKHLIARLQGVRWRTFIQRASLWLLLLDVAFVFLMPIFVLVSNSLKGVMDTYDPTVVWIPRRLELNNYTLALAALEYKQSFTNTLIMAGLSALLQTLSCALVGYGFARMRFPGRDLLFLLVLFGLIVPPQALIIQHFIMYSRDHLNWLNTYRPFVIPAATAMGLRGGLFVFIFRQFFKGVPWELEDAGKIDGAGPLRVFTSIILPLAQPAIVVVFLFSFVWHWNASTEPAIYILEATKHVLSQRLSVLESSLALVQLRGLYSTGTIMAAALLVIFPLLALYMAAQRYFVESIERTGLIG